MNAKIYSRESNIDDCSLHFVCETSDWRTYLGDNGIFLGQDLPHSRIDYYVYDKENLIFDTRHGYHLNNQSKP